MWCKINFVNFLRTTNKHINVLRTERRLYHYKPKDKKTGDATIADSKATKDLILFRYEDPNKMMRRAAMGGAVMVICSLGGYNMYGVSGEIKKNVERVGRREDKDFIYNTVDSALSGVSIAFVVAGLSLGVYWLTRVMYTVRRLVLRKGGKSVTIVTYGPFAVNSKAITVPLSHVRSFLYDFKSFACKRS